MKELTFENVMNGDYELKYEINKEVGEHYESCVSFKRGRDFNQEIREYIEDYVNKFKEFLTDDNVAAMNERLVKYNKLVVDLRTDILSSVKIPSTAIAGGSNYPINKKRKEMERTHAKEYELYSREGKHARFLENTSKMFDPILIEERDRIENMRKKRSADEGWTSFYKELDHDEIEGYGLDVENNRIYVKTYTKPEEDLRTVLKACALRWSPKNRRWQRILTKNAIFSLQNNFKTSLDIELEVPGNE